MQVPYYISPWSETFRTPKEALIGCHGTGYESLWSKAVQSGAGYVGRQTLATAGIKARSKKKIDKKGHILEHIKI